MRRFEGRVAVVTGAASGIGRATAEALAARQCRLALVDVNEPALQQLAEEIRAAGGRASLHLTDVSDAKRMAELPAEVVGEHGGVHILVNNAGVAASGTLEETSLQDYEWVVGINFWGVVYGCKFFLPHLREQDEGHIVNISSMFGFVGLPTQGAYCATKFAVRGFSESLWAELHDTQIGVTSVHPGGIRTNIVRDSRTSDDEARIRAIDLFERFGSPPEKVATAIVRAIEKRKLRVLVNREAYATEWLKRLFPVSLHRLVRMGYRRGGAIS